jgi:hypothetical protein
MAFSDEEIHLVREEETRLPVTHRRGFGSQTDDVAEDANGMPTQVPTPETPFDQFG